MAKLNIVLDDKIEEQFRKTVFERKGMKKGNISEAFQEAVTMWMQTTAEPKRKRTE